MTVGGWLPCFRYPARTDAGTYRVVCSCGDWQFVGTAEEVYIEGGRHDDSPWMHHVVSVRARKVVAE